MSEFNGERLNFNAAQRLDRSIDQLIGICAGIAADGSINDAEIAYLSTWLRENRDVCKQFPGLQLAARVSAALADGYVTPEESEDLLELLKQISGNRFVETGAAEAEAPAIPGDVVEEIVFAGKRFCFTGKFAFGTRKRCEDAVIALGGIAVGNVTRELDYLILGCGVSKDWKHESYGRKIEHALSLREGGKSNPAIIAEKVWVVMIDQGIDQ